MPTDLPRPLRVAMAADHNGVALKAHLSDRLRAQGHVVSDHGVFTTETVDYPYLCAAVCEQVVRQAADFAIVIGGSGQGESIACNKVQGIRAALCLTHFTTEIARANNNANVMVIGAKVVAPELAEELLDLWCATPFKGGVHQRRLDLIAAMERGLMPRAHRTE